MCLVNRYVDGESTMGLHADDEDDVDQSVPICSVSFGALRDLKFKPTKNNDDCFTVPLHDGHILFMSDPTQKNWKHAVPKRRKCKTPRVSLTFRKVFTDDVKNDSSSSDQNKQPAEKKSADKKIRNI